ncbi:efflux RND transporter periplasmic adaptor subunit [Jiangella endophytica]|uniref:efflux RND transporter periplasmic adaptor subunit n=1 Tax=Jiangella endophytica TaxID=1623398 RepID=UPI0018E544C8|nr:HlyD family efflux transporter periplasmic adaptor subunit [Jiangella endophytica]
MPETFAVRRRPRRRRKLRLLVAAGLTVLVAGGAAGVWAVTVAGEEPSYRTVAAGLASVAETLDGTGTVAAASSAAAGFGASGTVASVDVAAGDPVTVGQQLAALDTTDLAADLADAEAELAQAEAALEATIDGQAESVSASSSSSPSSSAATAVAAAYVRPAGDGPGAGSGGSGGAAEQLPELQQAVLAAQQAAGQSLAQAAAALEAQQQACATAMSPAAPASFTATPSPSETPPPSVTPTDAPTETPSPSESPTETPSPTPDLAPCLAALQAAQQAQQRAAADQQSLQQAIAALADLLATAGVPSEPEEPSTPSSPPSSPAEGEQQAPSPSDEQQGPGGTELSDAAQLAGDQAAVTEAELRVLQAEQALAAATIVAPIAGTVAAVGLTPGATADAGTITVVAPGAITVTAGVSETDVRRLQVGTAAEVRPAGAAETVDGEVVSIGLIPDSSSGSPRYPVVVGVAEPPATAATGSAAEVSFLLGEAAEVLTVPNSAITLTADGGTVRVLAGGEVEVTPVTIGVVGSERTEIVDGLTAGDQVVLADLGADLPSSDSAPFGGGGGAFLDGGGFGGGGFGGVRPPSFRGVPADRAARGSPPRTAAAPRRGVRAGTRPGGG